jgi:hypothetical protein
VVTVFVVGISVISVTVINDSECSDSSGLHPGFGMHRER